MGFAGLRVSVWASGVMVGGGDATRSAARTWGGGTPRGQRRGPIVCGFGMHGSSSVRWLRRKGSRSLLRQVNHGDACNVAPGASYTTMLGRYCHGEMLT